MERGPHGVSITMALPVPHTHILQTGEAGQLVSEALNNVLRKCV